jgi:hypothetical protein
VLVNTLSDLPEINLFKMFKAAQSWNNAMISRISKNKLGSKTRLFH